MHRLLGPPYGDARGMHNNSMQKNFRLPYAPCQGHPGADSPRWPRKLEELHPSNDYYSYYSYVLLLLLLLLLLSILLLLLLLQ